MMMRPSTTLVVLLRRRSASKPEPDSVYLAPLDQGGLFLLVWLFGDSMQVELQSLICACDDWMDLTQHQSPDPHADRS